MIIEGKCGRLFHFQKPIDLLECYGVTFGENVVDDRPNKSTRFASHKKLTETLDLLYPVVEAPMGEGSEVLLNHAVHPLNENSVLRLEEFVARVDPLLDRLFYEPFGHHKRIIIGEFPGFSSTLHMRG